MQEKKLSVESNFQVRSHKQINQTLVTSFKMHLLLIVVGCRTAELP